MSARSISFNQAIQAFGLLLHGKSIPYGIGCAWLGRKYPGAESIKRDVGILNKAYKSGFRYYDTSAAYGESELIVGEFLNGIPRESIFLATKSRIPARITPQLAGEYVKVNLKASLQRMNCSSIDLFQIHDVTDLTQVLASGGVLEVLLEAKKQGIIRYIGLATRDLQLLEQAVRQGDFDTILTYSDYTPLEPKAHELVHLAKLNGVGVVNGSPLCNGLLTDNVVKFMPQSDEPELLFRRGLAIEFCDLCRTQGISALKVALHFPLLQPYINLTLTGPGSQKELMQTLELLEQGMTDDEWERLKEWWRRIGFEQSVKGLVKHN